MNKLISSGRGEKRLLRGNGGAASIIVVFMILVLFVLGMLALTTALANLRLSVKSSEWIKDFYKLEINAEELLMKVDASLETAEKKAREKVIEQNGEAEGFKSFEEEFGRWYYYYACEELEKLPKENIDQLELYKETYMERGDDLESMQQPLAYLVVDYPKSKKHIYISFQAKAPDYSFTPDMSDPFNIVLSAKRVDPAELRYEIIEWREVQDPIDYSQAQQFWNGQIQFPDEHTKS